ncbi:hypothetical protein KL925_001617 [Ogataea polymorpha]|nr:hypothetical protein KL925_001617 [Ogataea polymorpha]
MSQMKGLVQFITDIRNSKEQEQEDRRVQSELVHIQKQFQQPNLSGYHRKKYICKLLYIYLMGHELTFGLDEAMTLARSKVYSEKSIGYLALSLFYQTRTEAVDAIFETIHNDLAHPKEDFVCLALQFLSSVADSDAYSRAFENDVFNLIRSPVSSALVRKKAVLTLLQLLKIDPLLVTRHPNVISRVAPLINDTDFGVSIAAVSLVQHVAKLDVNLCNSCTTLALEKLHKIVVEDECPPSHMYHGIPAPWLTVKLFQLLETLVPNVDAMPLDQANMHTVKTVIQRAISTALSQTPLMSAEARHTRDFVLLGAVSLAAHVDPSPDQSTIAADALCQLLQSTETNTRYLSLAALAKLAARNDDPVLMTINKHIEHISSLLRDRDVSVRRLSLDLMYIICNSNTVQQMCQQLLEYLSVTDFAMKSEVAVKIAVLAEKYATNATWYVTTMMKLISVAGNYLDEEVRQRLIQIVVNNDSIQATACRLCYSALKSGTYPESMVKVAAFLLGEFGTQLDIPLVQQFDLLHSCYFQTSVMARCVLLSSFLKFYVHEPQIRPRILDLYEQESNSFIAEIQQRCLEYSKLATLPDKSLLSLVVVDMPPFQSNISPLISRLGNVQQLQQSFQLNLPYAAHSSSSLERPKSPKKPAPPRPRSRKNTNSVMSLSLNVASASPSRSETDDSSRSMSHFSDSQFSYNSTANPSVDHLPAFSPNWKEGYYRLLHYDQGIFYEDSLFKILFRLRRNHAQLHYELFYSNKSPSTISGLTSEVVSKLSNTEDPGYVIKVIKHPESTITANSKSVQIFDVSVRKPYLDTEVPIINISFVCGTLCQYKLRLPAVVGKIMVRGTPLSKESFFTRWSQISSLPGGECQKVIRLSSPMQTVILSRTMQLFGFNLLKNIDYNMHNIVCTGILSMAAGGAGCLMRIETNPQDARVLRITMRCTVSGLADILVGTLTDLLNNI